MFRPIVAAAAILFVAGAAAGQTDAKAPANKETRASQPADASQKPFALMVGDKAPQLQVEKWVKGEPVTGFEKGKVYLVEFWATWCGPCIAAMPHISKLQKEYKDDGLTVIGMTSADPSNTLSKVEKMVADKGDVMGYTVAWDTERKTNEAYMKAAGQNGIPCSYVVDRNGLIAYIGHPTAGGAMDEVIEQVVAGTFDMNKAKAQYAKEMAAEAQLQPLQMKFGQAMQGQDWEAAHKAANEIADIDPRMGAQALNVVAWSIVDPDGGVENKNLDVALKAAERAVELGKGKDAAILDTLALTHFLKGNTAKAIEIQTKAVDLADDAMKEELQTRLDEFKAKK